MTATASVSKSAFKKEYMQPFVDSMRNLFESHLSDSLTFGKLTLNQSNSPPYDVSGVIGFTGTVTGRAVVSFPMAVATKICADYLRMDPLPPGAVEDCVGELANVIVGRAKSSLEQHSIVISPPTVVTGSDFTIAPQRDAACLSIPCECKHGPMQLDISMIDNAAMGAKL